MPESRARDLIRDISIRHSIFICFTVSAVVASILVGVSLYGRLADQLARTVQEENQVLMGQVSQSLDSYLRTIMKLSDSLYYGVIKKHRIVTGTGV